MSEAFEEGMPQSETTSFLPFLLLALLAVGYWLWSRSGTDAAAAAAPLPNAEELRRRRLEALQGKVSTTSTEAAVAAPVQATAEDGLRKRAVAEEAAKARETKENKETKGTKETETKADKAQPKPEATPTPAKAQSNQGPARKDLSTQSAPKPKEEVPKPVPPVPPVPPSTLALRARGTIKGTSHVRNVEVKGESNVEQLQAEVSMAFPEAAGSKVRIFFNGKELKTLTDSLDSLGISSNVCLQVMFTPVGAQAKQEVEEAKKEDVNAVKEPPTVSELPAPEEEALSVRIQSTVKGHTSAYVIKELTTCNRVLDLEALSLGAFAPGEGMRPRLFFMGKELKDGEAFLGHVGLKPNGTATVQVMFAPGEPRIAAKVPVSEEAPVATASAAAGGSPSPAVEEGTNEAVLAAAAAAGCNVSALQGTGEATVGTTGTPAEAWRAMAGLEEQLSRETDMSEEQSVRQASGMLRQLLTTATHDDNPGLMQFAQSAVPDLQRIWSFEPTREHLKGLLAMKAQNQGRAVQLVGEEPELLCAELGTV